MECAAAPRESSAFEDWTVPQRSASQGRARRAAAAPAVAGDGDEVGFVVVVDVAPAVVVEAGAACRVSGRRVGVVAKTMLIAVSLAAADVVVRVVLIVVDREIDHPVAAAAEQVLAPAGTARAASPDLAGCNSAARDDAHAHADDAHVDDAGDAGDAHDDGARARATATG